MRRWIVRAVVALSAVGVAPAFAAGPVDVLPVRISDGAVALHGDWAFTYVPASDVGRLDTFFEPTFDASAWKMIPVPAHWELHGFAEPKYKRVDEGTGLYRRAFRVPPAWRGQRIFLRFDGVLYGLTAWINGTPVGEWASGYNPVTFDVTDAIRPDGENLIAVRVTTRSQGYEFDTNDCWALSGIYRDVTLFALPSLHLADYTARTTLRPDGTADLEIAVAASGTGRVEARLLAPDGRPAGGFTTTLDAKGRGTGRVAVARPQLWTAETPSRYRLELALRSGGRVVQRLAEPVGLRQVTIEDGVLKLNGAPIKLRGVDHHDIWPIAGRVASDELIRRDLELMREANVNFIRTAHYPPHPRLIELCDELGFYVIDEVPFGFGDAHLTDPAYLPVLLTRARATVMRDKNRPSVIVWSIGNENPITPIQLDTGREVKRLDPTRPICFPTVGSYFEKNYAAFPAFVDIYAPHYPSNARLRDYAERLGRPVIVTEYAHQLGLAGDRVQDQWEQMYASPRLAGGAVWMFQDQGLLRTAATPIDASTPTQYAWIDPQHYYDTAGTDGADGIVYSDRTPQADYWQVRKVYSPVQIAERAIAARPGRQTLTIHAENRFDFRSLSGVSVRWSLLRNGQAMQEGVVGLSAAPRGTDTLSMEVTIPADPAGDVFAVDLRCVDERGRQLHERTIRLEIEAAPTPLDVVRGERPQAGTLAITSDVIHVRHPRVQLQLTRRTGHIEILDATGGALVQAMGPHAGRPFTMAEELRAVKASIWRGDLLGEAAEIETDARPASGGAGTLVTVRGKYRRPDAPDQLLVGECRLVVTPSGVIDVEYEYVPVNAAGTLLEAGLAMRLSRERTEFRWIGQGPYAGYPGKDRLNEFGLFHLTRDDIRFQGNRRDVDAAMLTTPAGAGVIVTGARMDVAVLDTAGGIVLSHNARVAGPGNKGGEPETQLEASRVGRITGAFSLAPVDGPWPAAVSRWFGPPGSPAPALTPFYRSYDR